MPSRWGIVTGLQVQRDVLDVCVGWWAANIALASAATSMSVWRAAQQSDLDVTLDWGCFNTHKRLSTGFSFKCITKIQQRDPRHT